MIIGMNCMRLLNGFLYIKYKIPYVIAKEEYWERKIQRESDLKENDYV